VTVEAPAGPLVVTVHESAVGRIIVKMHGGTAMERAEVRRRFKARFWRHGQARWLDKARCWSLAPTEGRKVDAWIWDDLPRWVEVDDRRPERWW
jgi:hypothetical protein